MEICLPLSEQYKMLSEMEKFPSLGEVLCEKFWLSI